MYEVVVCDNEGRELRRFDLSELTDVHHSRTGRVVIGRAEDCGIRLKVGSVSRHHCAVERDEEGEWIVRDLGSTHGTLIDGTRIEETPLKDHLTVRIGPALIRFEPTAAALAQKLKQEIEATE